MCVLLLVSRVLWGCFGEGPGPAMGTGELSGPGEGPVAGGRPETNPPPPLNRFSPAFLLSHLLPPPTLSFALFLFGLQGFQEGNQQLLQPEKVGWVRKFCGKGIFREIWKNRFVVLKGDQLYISEKEVGKRLLTFFGFFSQAFPFLSLPPPPPSSLGGLNSAILVGW